MHRLDVLSVGVERPFSDLGDVRRNGEIHLVSVVSVDIIFSENAVDDRKSVVDAVAAVSLNPRRVVESVFADRKDFVLVHNAHVLDVAAISKRFGRDVRSSASVDGRTRCGFVNETIIHAADDDCFRRGIVRLAFRAKEVVATAERVFADILNRARCADNQIVECRKIFKRIVVYCLDIVAERNCFKCRAVCKSTRSNSVCVLYLQIEFRNIFRTCSAVFGGVIFVF